MIVFVVEATVPDADAEHSAVRSVMAVHDVGWCGRQRDNGWVVCALAEDEQRASALRADLVAVGAFDVTVEPEEVDEW